MNRSGNIGMEIRPQFFTPASIVLGLLALNDHVHGVARKTQQVDVQLFFSKADANARREMRDSTRLDRDFHEVKTHYKGHYV